MTAVCCMGYCDKPAICFYDLKKYGLRAFCKECGETMTTCSVGNQGFFDKRHRISLDQYETALVAQVMED